MNILRKTAWLIILFSSTCSVLAQQPLRQQAIGTNTKIKKAPIASNAAVQRRKDAVLLIKDFVSRAWGFRDLEAKANTIISLANTLWKDDEPFSRQLFLTTYDLVKNIKLENEGANASTSPKIELTASTVLNLRSRVIAALSRHYPTLAKKLAADDELGSNNSTINYSTAMNLLANGNTDEAVRFAKDGLRSEVSNTTIMFLLQLRRKDKAKADDLFIQALNLLITKPFVDGMDLMKFGSYVFTAPHLDQTQRESGSMVMMIIGKTLVVNLTADRPDVPPLIVRAYLNAATTILTRQVSDPKEQELYYVAGHQLLPKLQHFAPELIPQFTSAMNALSGDVPPALTQEAAYATLGPPVSLNDDDYSKMLDKIANIPDVQRRDETYFLVVSSAYQNNQFNRARKAAEKITDAGDDRAKLFDLIDFGEATQFIKTGQTMRGEEIVRKLEPSIERVLLWLEISREHLKKREVDSAAETLGGAIQDIRRLDGDERPFLFLAAATQYADFDHISAMQILNEAVKEFNVGTGKYPKWQVPVRVGNKSLNFSFKGIKEPNIYSIIQHMFPINHKETISAVLMLKPEPVLGIALSALANSLLSEIASK